MGVEADPGGGRTRLISRLKQYYAWEKTGRAIFTLVLLEFGGFPMMRRVLKGINVLAERISALQARAATGVSSEPLQVR